MVKFAVSLCASLVVLAAPAAAQNVAVPAPNAQAEAQQAPAAKPAPVAEPKICKRLPQGKVCMTETKWKAYQEMN